MDKLSIHGLTSIPRRFPRQSGERHKIERFVLVTISVVISETLQSVLFLTTYAVVGPWVLYFSAHREVTSSTVSKAAQ